MEMSPSWQGNLQIKSCVEWQPGGDGVDKSMKKDNLPQDIQGQWESSMKRQLDTLRASIQQDAVEPLAMRCGGRTEGDKLILKYWQHEVSISWPELGAYDETDSKKLSLFDTTLVLYYLKTADNTPMADRWVSFRELPGGAFYHQAFQGYSGDRMARIFEHNLDRYCLAAKSLDGVRLTGISDYVYAFKPLPRLRLATILWPGDDEFPGRGSILFDAAAIHYMVLDGLAILGSRLVSKLEKAQV